MTFLQLIAAHINIMCEHKMRETEQQNKPIDHIYPTRRYNFCHEDAEDAIYDMPMLAHFVAVDLASERVPASTPLKKFRHFQGDNQLAPKVLDQSNALLANKALMLRESTIVDTTLIAATPSTKNKGKVPDPKMHQTKKGSEWPFGTKVNLGVDAISGLTHPAVGTSANIRDVVMAGQLLQQDDKIVFPNASYTGVAKRTANEG